jgi:4-amino-4-deoxy-L-arabinose transferase-like glycosyltransferase
VAARLPGIGLFITPDEDNWMRRAGNFAQALESGRLHRTYRSGHPGVTTMWIVGLALGPEVESLASTTGSDPIVTRVPGFMDKLVRARLAFVVVNAGLVVAMAVLIWRLLGPGPVALVAPLLALDPFLLAHAQVVHLDALSAALMTVAVLAGAVFWWSNGGRGYLVLCGVATGLAVLTKAPSLFLGLFVPGMAIWAGARGGWRRGWAALLSSVLVCGAVAAAVVFAIWPAMWVEPVETIERAIEFQMDQAGTPHQPGNFFLGRPTSDPGPLFYPVALAFRLSPPVFVGVAILAIILPPAALRRHATLLVSFALGFLLFLTIANKKLDRYALPLFPSLSILAGIGLWSLWAWLRPKAPPGLFALAVVLVAMLQALPVIGTSPYLLGYYNPLLGGPRAAERVMLVGWGEGLDQVAAYLNAQPGAADSRIAVYFPMERNLQGMVSGTVQRFGDREPADYVVDYLSASQRRQTPVEVAGTQPEFVATINGVEYARVYRIQPPRVIRNP